MFMTVCTFKNYSKFMLSGIYCNFLCDESQKCIKERLVQRTFENETYIKDKRVLIVDDAVVARMNMRRMLIQLGMQIIGDSEDGIDAMRKAGELKPDLIFMDMIMPYVDGITAAEEITKKYENISIIIVSGLRTKQLMSAAYRAGIKNFITKPFNMDDVKTVLSDLEIVE